MTDLKSMTLEEITAAPAQAAAAAAAASNESK